MVYRRSQVKKPMSLRLGRSNRYPLSCRDRDMCPELSPIEHTEATQLGQNITIYEVLVPTKVLDPQCE